MQFLEIIDRINRSFSQLLDRADHRELARWRSIERQRQAPVALAGDTPVPHVAQPILHALAVLLWHPVDCRRSLNHRLPYLVGCDKPFLDDSED